MSLGVIKNVVRLVILVMVFECISAALTPANGDSANITVIKKPSSTSLLASVFIEKAEEEQKTEEESDKFTQVILVDFSRVVFELSNVHTSNGSHIALLQPNTVERSLFRLFCTFLI